MLESVFGPASEYLGLPLDQVRYILLLFGSYPIAFLFRYALHPDHTPVYTRHIVSTFFGVAMATICFDWQVFYLVGVIAVSYILLFTVPPHLVQRVTMVWVMGCMCTAHLYRLLTDYGGYHLDFTGPLMVLVQKLSLVAFAVHDGRGNPGPLNKDQEKQKLSSRPSILEYLSYNLNFHTILAGPAITFKEYMAFMDGSNVQLLENPNQFAKAKEHTKEPSPLYPVLTKLIYTLTAMVLHLALSGYAVHVVLDPTYSLPQRLVVAYLSALYIRCRYYFIWLLADSINNAAGLGFSGYDKLGRAQWDVATNMRVVDVELGMNLRTIANAWNVKTSLWLRRVCFERLTWHPALFSFALSAIWHGFYPGYYACFIFLGLGVEAGKRMRRLMNAYFQNKGLVVKYGYHIVTLVTTHIILDFGTLPVVLLWWPETWLYWKYHYLFPLILVMIVILFFPTGHSQRDRQKRVGDGEVVRGKEGVENNINRRKENALSADKEKHE